MSEDHVALIVEDEPPIAAALVEIAASRAHGARRASTLEDVRAAAAEGGYCYVLLDMQIPTAPGGRPLVSAGETALALLRKGEPRRNARGRHLLPILVVTGYSSDPDFIWRIYDAEADGFVTKPFGDRVEVVLSKIREALASAGREEHAACTAPVDDAAASDEPRAAAARAPAPVVLVIDGEKQGRRTGFLVNGKRRELQDGRFAVLLRLIAVHLRNPGAWSSRQELGIARSPEVPSRIRKELEGAVPERFDVIVSDRGGSCRLNPEVLVERVAWDALAAHPDPKVQRIAREHAARAGSKT